VASDPYRALAGPARWAPSARSYRAIPHNRQLPGSLPDRWVWAALCRAEGVAQTTD